MGHKCPGAFASSYSFVNEIAHTLSIKEAVCEEMAATEDPISDFIKQFAAMQTGIDLLKSTAPEYELVKLLRGEATIPDPLPSRQFRGTHYRAPERWIVHTRRPICNEAVMGVWDCAYLFFNMHGELGGTCVLHTILRQITMQHTEAEFRDRDLNWVRYRDPGVPGYAGPDLPWNTEGADLGLVQRVLKNEKYCYLGLFYLHFCDFFESLAAWEEIVTGVSPFCSDEITRRRNRKRAVREGDTDQEWPRRYFQGVHEAFGHVLRNFWCLVSLTLPASAQIVDTSYVGSGPHDDLALVFPYVYAPRPPSHELWMVERGKIARMLQSNGGNFKIDGKDVNSASHATYSHALRNNELWCGVLQEVGWHLQEIMRGELHIYEPEGIRENVENVHIGQAYFVNGTDWHLPSPYDSLLSIQHQEMFLQCENMKRKYTEIEDNDKAVKVERQNLYHNIAEFLQAHMPSSAKITTRTQRLEQQVVQHDTATGGIAATQIDLKSTQQLNELLYRIKKCGDTDI